MNPIVLYGMPPIDSSPRITKPLAFPSRALPEVPSAPPFVGTLTWTGTDPKGAIRFYLRAAITAALDAKLHLLANTITMALAELEKTP